MQSELLSSIYPFSLWAQMAKGRPGGKRTQHDYAKRQKARGATSHKPGPKPKNTKSPKLQSPRPKPTVRFFPLRTPKPVPAPAAPAVRQHAAPVTPIALNPECQEPAVSAPPPRKRPPAKRPGPLWMAGVRHTHFCRPGKPPCGNPFCHFHYPTDSEND